ncbi:MAG: DUF1800 domain-containing protein [Myxococcota bacterium]
MPLPTKPLLIAGALSLGGCAEATAQPRPAPSPQEDRALVAHTLGRFTFGPRPGDLERVAAMGLDVWLEAQLRAKSDPVPDPFRYATLPPLELFEEATGQRMMAEEGGVEEAVPSAPPVRKKRNKDIRKKLKSLNFKKLASAYTMAQLARQISSDDQVVEVMTDFWMNHFNVFARKGPVKFYAGHYVETAIRPHVLGRFEDLVIATAQHPAMLNYLDNVKSRAPLEGRALERRRRRDAQRMERGQKPVRRRDLNENYARELLELHTVGTTHSQADVVAAARVLTGWGTADIQNGGGFAFKPKLHDRGTKTVLGRRFGPGLDEGVDMLRFLARHPATGRLLGDKLCQRFVADVPPPSCVERVAAAHQSSGGDIPSMLRAVYTSPSFRGSRTSKLKTPLEFLVSSLRALDARPVDDRLARVLYRLGQPTLMMPVPTGYPDVAEAWTGSSSILQRMNLAAALGRGKLPGVELTLDRVLPLNAEDLVAEVHGRVLSGRGGPHTLMVLRQEVAKAKDPRQARSVAIALALGSPEFMRQ